jgi:hypothetical protein
LTDGNCGAPLDFRRSDGGNGGEGKLWQTDAEKENVSNSVMGEAAAAGRKWWDRRRGSRSSSLDPATAAFATASAEAENKGRSSRAQSLSGGIGGSGGGGGGGVW